MPDVRRSRSGSTIRFILDAARWCRSRSGGGSQARITWSWFSQTARSLWSRPGWRRQWLALPLSPRALGYRSVGSSSMALGPRCYSPDRRRTAGSIRRKGRAFLLYVTLHPPKITFGELRQSGIREVPIYCRDHRCSHSISMSADYWPTKMRVHPVFLGPLCTKQGVVIGGIHHSILKTPSRNARCSGVGSSAECVFRPSVCRSNSCD
jgi:hypothetical protein